MTAESGQNAAAAVPASERRPLVLVVEDEEMVGQVVQAMLEMGGYESVHASGGAEALELLRNSPRRFDLMITDFLMPRMTGIELIQQCKNLRPDLRTILYSGNADARDTANYAVQPNAFLRKPFTPKTLNSIVREILGR